MLADELNLKRETVKKILTDDLSMKKLCANMVPKNLLAEQKHVQMSISQDCLEQVEADPTLLDRVITGDESWYFQYDPETKRQSQQWLSPGAARPKKARMSKSNLRSSSNEYVCDQSRPCTSNEQYLDTNDTLVISGMSNDVCDSALVEKTVINADKNETHNNKCKYYRYIGDFLEEDLETPRRRKLFWNTHTKMLDEKNQKKRLLEQKNRRLESKISSLNTLVDELKKECQLNASYSHILKNIGTEEGKQLLMRQLQISTGKSICPILRKFAMTLHFYSPSAYSYVRTIFSKALPDVSTIRKWYSKLDGLPGMTKESFQAISLKVKEMKVNGKQLYGCLVMDEMSIKQHVHWTGTRHQGYIDFGLGGKTEEMDNLPYAKDAFVIMVVDINTSWKVPIAYYLINGISAEEKANIILNCLQELDTTGVIIKTLTFDGAANNFSMASELEANLQYSEDHIEMLFSAIRAKGGFNNNPTVSQFEAAYKSIIVHSEIKSSSSANCMALDDTIILTVSSSNIKVKDTQSELLDLLCVAGTDDLENDNLLSVYQHSNFINDVVACIAGFVVRKIKKKTILCDTCAVEIEVGSSESKLLDRKNRGGLIKPSHDVVQISKSSLSPSHIKNTKNNLTIHPIKIVKSNDNTNNWQTVPIRSPSTPTSPNPKIQKTNSFSSKNRFSALATNEISYENSNEVEMLSQEISNVQPKIPPIYIKDDIDFFDFCKKIKPFTDPDGFNTKSSSSGLKLMTYSINAYRQIIKFLEINNMNFHTYQTNEEKAFRVVIRHLHHTTPTDYIKEELHSLGFITRSITNCLQYKTKNPLPLFFVDLEPSPSNHNIYRVDSICYTKIKIEAPHPKKNPVQCLKCQNYGHTRTYCHHTPRCVKCGDIHLSSECQKDSNTPATCALCSGDHPASYKGCPKFKLLQKGRSTIKTNRPTETQDSSSTSIKTNTIQENNFPPLCQPQWSTSQSTTIQNLPNTHSHPKKNQNLTEPCVNPNTDSVTTQLTNFLVQFQSLVK
ncbi:hypothetical protein QTP88_000123 [Uroleucon formosanum]